MPNETITVIVIVNGAPVEVPVNPNASLEALISHALNESHNNGQPKENWELKDPAGNVIDPHKKWKDLGLPSGATLSLYPRAGVGG